MNQHEYEIESSDCDTDLNEETLLSNVQNQNEVISILQRELEQKSKVIEELEQSGSSRRML